MICYDRYSVVYGTVKKMKTLQVTVWQIISHN
uniref:Uncharacterized protein n=1 Tax=Anguilla anguilla TaxID=7936 RepID=A0A0E9SHD2_ANGAN